jgi:hypothetical protein
MIKSGAGTGQQFPIFCTASRPFQVNLRHFPVRIVILSGLGGMMIRSGPVRSLFVVVLLAAIPGTAFAQAPPTWTELGGSASGGGISGNPWPSLGAKMAVGPDGNPVVAWHETNPAGTNIYLRRWDGTSWAELQGSASGSGLTSSESGGESIAISAAGLIFVAYHTWNGGAWDIHVVRWDGSSWSGIGGSAQGGGISNTSKPSRFPSIAVDPDGRPWVAWTETVDVTEEIFLRRWTGSAWVEAGDSASGDGISHSPQDSSTFPALAVDSQGHAIVAWEQKTEDVVTPYGNYSAIEIYASKWNGVTWVELGGSASGGGISNFKLGHCYSPNVVVDSQGRPVVAWTRGPYSFQGSSSREVFLVRWSGSAWTELGGSGSGLGVSGQRADANGEEQYCNGLSLALDPADHPIVAWTEGSTVNSYQVRARRWTGLAWDGLEGSDEDAGLGSSDASDGRPAVSVAPSGDTFIAWGEGTAADQEIFLRQWRNVRTSALEQLASDGSPVGIGQMTADTILVFRGKASRPQVSYPLKLQFEVRPIGADFTGVPTAETEFKPSDTLITLSLANFAAGGWHWRVRALESTTGFVSAWESFGGNPDNFADFWVNPEHGKTPAEEDSGGGSGKKGCGLLGVEGPVLLWLLLRLRRRRPTPA